MNREHRWTKEGEGAPLEFSYTKWNKVHAITINGNTFKFSQKWTEWIVGLDEEFTFNEKKARLVVRGKNLDVVIDGKFTKDGSDYTPSPKWIWVFIVLCGLIPISTLGGALPAVIGVLGIQGCIMIVRTSMSRGVQILLCSLVTVFAWVLAWALTIIIFGALG